MARKRLRFTAEFKAPEALRGDCTIQSTAAQHEVHPNQVSDWKRQTRRCTCTNWPTAWRRSG